MCIYMTLSYVRKFKNFLTKQNGLIARVLKDLGHNLQCPYMLDAPPQFNSSAAVYF